MSENTWGFVATIVLSLGTVVMVWALVRRGLRALIDGTVGIAAATTFYARVFVIGLLFVALTSLLGARFDFGPDAAFMEYVWRIASVLSGQLGLSCIFLGVYLVLVTILAAALGRRNEQ